jgi:hypothetical protein
MNTVALFGRLGGSMTQPLLMMNHGLEAIHTLVISRQRDFDGLFEGFTGLQAISYVSSADLLLEFLDKRGFEHIELLVGENLDTKQLKEDLARKDPTVTVRLAEELEAGRLRLFVPPRPVHTKFYILSRGEEFRLVMTSANLSRAAQRASGQVNYAWYLDLQGGHPFMEQMKKDFQTHCKGADLFMGDLTELFKRRRDISVAEVVAVWLGTEQNGSRDSAEVRAVMRGLVSEVFAHPGEEEQPVIQVSLPAAPGARQQTQQLLRPLGIDAKNQETAVSPLRVVRYVEETHGVPLMRVNVSKQEVWLGFRGDIQRIDASLGPSEEVNKALEDVESYVRTVELGECPDPTFAKMSMYEALLYIMAMPFANELMKERRRRSGIVNRRGPRFLYIYGPAQNGKTTFLRYSLKLITGSLIEPLQPAWFTKLRVQGAQAVGTCFPLMFDDMSSFHTKTFEDLAKSHWETSWTEKDQFPQLVFTSNILHLKEWAKSRMKRIDFDVHYVPTTRNQEHLASILEKHNPLYGWFAREYVERMSQPSWLQDDELATAREVMRNLYGHATRSLPSYFPGRPLEELYDPDLRVWKELLRHDKAKIHRDRDQTVIQFSEDLEDSETLEYRSALPQTIKYKKRGKTVIVENPKSFDTWLKGGGAKQSLVSRLLRRG